MPPEVAKYPCPKCGRELEGSGFYFSKGKRTSWCRSCMRAAMRARYGTPEGRTKKLAYQYGEETKARRRARKKRLRAAGAPEILGELCRIRLCAALSGRMRRSASAVRDLGCSLEEFRGRLESKFLPGMSWENRGARWEIDHIVPFHRVDALDPVVLRKLVHHTNLRPLFREDNLLRNRREVLDAELEELGLLLPGGAIRFPIDQVPKSPSPQVPKSQK